MIEVKCNKTKCFFNNCGTCTKKDGITIVDRACESYWIAIANRRMYDPDNDERPFGNKY